MLRHSALCQKLGARSGVLGGGVGGGGWRAGCALEMVLHLAEAERNDSECCFGLFTGGVTRDDVPGDQCFGANALHASNVDWCDCSNPLTVLFAQGL